MNFNLTHNIILTNLTPLVNILEKSSGMFFYKNTLDDFYITTKTPKPNYKIFLNNSIFCKNGDSVVVT
jgi:hypothetical protein